MRRATSPWRPQTREAQACSVTIGLFMSELFQNRPE